MFILLSFIINNKLINHNNNPTKPNQTKTSNAKVNQPIQYKEFVRKTGLDLGGIKWCDENDQNTLYKIPKEWIKNFKDYVKYS